MTSTIARYLTGKRRPSSTLSASDSCASPDTSDSKVRQEKKKPKKDRTDSTNEDMTIEEALDDIRQQLLNVATKDDIQHMQEEMNKITSRLDIRIEQLESTLFEMQNERDVLASEVKALKEENKELRTKVDQAVKEDRSIRRDLNDQEQHGRQSNVRVYGLTEVQGGKETVEDCVTRCVDVFTKKIGVPVTKEDVEIAHRIGKPGGSRPRPVIVRFHSRILRGRVLAERRKLKQTGVSVGEDLTQQNYKLLKLASDHSASLSAWSSNGKILTKIKNGKIIKLDIDMDVGKELTKAML